LFKELKEYIRGYQKVRNKSCDPTYGLRGAIFVICRTGSEVPSSTHSEEQEGSQYLEKGLREQSHAFCSKRWISWVLVVDICQISMFHFLTPEKH